MLHDAHPQTGIRHHGPVSQLPIRPAHTFDDSLRLVAAVSVDREGIPAERRLMRPRTVRIPGLTRVSWFGVPLTHVLNSATSLLDLHRFGFLEAMECDVRVGYDLCSIASYRHRYHFDVELVMNEVKREARVLVVLIAPPSKRLSPGVLEFDVNRSVAPTLAHAWKGLWAAVPGNRIRPEHEDTDARNGNAFRALHLSQNVHGHRVVDVSHAHKRQRDLEYSTQVARKDHRLSSEESHIASIERIALGLGRRAAQEPPRTLMQRALSGIARIRDALHADARRDGGQLSSARPSEVREHSPTMGGLKQGQRRP